MSSVEEFQSQYRDLSNDEIEWIALNKAATLRSEAVQALREEIGRRGLSRPVDGAIQAQTRRWTKGELDAFIERYRRRPCPRCGHQVELLNAVRAALARSFIILSAFEPKLVVGCPRCIRKEVERLSNLTMLLGWWGIPWGPINTMRALAINSKAKAAAGSMKPTAELHTYVASNIGEISADMSEH